MAKAMKSRSASSKTTKEKPKLSDLKQIVMGGDEDTQSNVAGNDSAKSDYSSDSNSMLNAPNSQVPNRELNYKKDPKLYKAPESISLDKSAAGSAKAAKSFAKTRVDSNYTSPYPKETPLRDLKAPDIVNQSKVSDPISSIGNMKAPGPKDSDYSDIKNNSNLASSKNFDAYSQQELDPSGNSSQVRNQVNQSLANSNSSVTQQNYKDNSGKIGKGDFSDTQKGNQEFKKIKDSAVKEGSPQRTSSILDQSVTDTKSVNVAMPEMPKESPGGDPMKGSVEPTKAKDDFTSKTKSQTKESIMSKVNESGLQAAGSLSINVFR